MKVHKLIERLSRLNPDVDVHIQAADNETYPLADEFLESNRYAFKRNPREGGSPIIILYDDRFRLSKTGIGLIKIKNSKTSVLKNPM